MIRNAAAVVPLFMALGTQVAPVAGEDLACWRGHHALERPGGYQEVICRIAGENESRFAGPGRVPVVLHPAMGRDAGGGCWYWSSRPGPWIIAALDGELALLRFDPDGPGGAPALADGWSRACTQLDVLSPGDLALVWEVVARYPFPEPDASLEPAIGVAGLETVLEVAKPGPFPEIRTVVSPVTAARIAVEIDLAAVLVAWGDDSGAAVVMTRGDPDGAWGRASHVYESAGEHRVAVSFVWDVSWWVAGEPPAELIVSPTAETTVYPVIELVGRRM